MVCPSWHLDIGSRVVVSLTKQDVSTSSPEKPSGYNPPQQRAEAEALLPRLPLLPRELTFLPAPLVEGERVSAQPRGRGKIGPSSTAIDTSRRVATIQFSSVIHPFVWSSKRKQE